MMRRTICLTVPTALCGVCTQAVTHTIKTVFENKYAVVIEDKNILEQRFSRTYQVTIDLHQVTASDQAIQEIFLEELQAVGHTLNTVRTTSFPMHLFKGALGLVFGFAALYLSAWPVLLAIISVGVAYYIGKETYHALLDRKLTQDTLFACSTLFMLGISIVGVCCPAWHISFLFHMVLFTLASKQIGAGIQQSAAPSHLGMSFLDRILPEQELTLSNKKKVFIKDLKKNQIVLLPGGSILPVDMQTLQACNVHNRIMDGQINSTPIPVNQLLPQGAMLAGPMDTETSFKVMASYKNSFLFKLQRSLLKLPSQQDLQDQLFLKKMTQFFFPALIFTALATGLIGYFLFSWPWLAVINTMLCVLTSFCPCTLGLIDGLAARSIKHLLQKNGYFTECNNSAVTQKAITHIMFDWHGTLTDPAQLNVIEIKPEPGVAEEELYKIIYCLEKNQPHPAAQAICKKISEAKGATWIANREEKLEQLDTTHHSGIAAVINEQAYQIGDKNRVTLAPAEECPSGQQYIYIQQGKKIIGRITLSFQLRDEALPVLKALQQQQKKIYICSGGDKKMILTHLAEKGLTGIDVIGNTVGYKLDNNLDRQRSKLAVIEELQKTLPLDAGVAAIGDGPNDIFFVAKSDLGIALKSEYADIMTEKAAHFSIQSLADLPAILALAEQMATRQAKLKAQNRGVSIVSSLLAMAVPMLLMGCTGIALPLYIAPWLMLMPLVGISLNTWRHEQIPLLIPTAKQFTAGGSGKQIRQGLSVSTLAVPPRPLPSPTLEDKTVYPPLHEKNKAKNPEPVGDPRQPAVPCLIR